MHILYSLLAVLFLSALGFVGGLSAGLRTLFGVIIPYGTILTFLFGFSYRVIRWARSPVPFRIPTTCGQQRSLPWIKFGRIENPSSAAGAVVRMALEVLCFRSLFRNTKAELRPEPKLIYGNEWLLGIGSLTFHWALLIIILRHLRFFLEPVPGFVVAMQNVDGFLQATLPTVYVTDLVLIAALAYLVFRRLQHGQVRYLSLFTDYFALFLLLGLAISGVYLRYFGRVDVVAVKQLALGLAIFSPSVAPEMPPSFFMHFFLLCVLIGYFPFSKLMHMGGIFLSPTRNLANNSRMKRHVNPWHHPVEVHSYAAWEEAFRDKLRSCGLPLERE
jgi:nitrate reductase gamma subunit